MIKLKHYQSLSFLYRMKSEKRTHIGFTKIDHAIAYELDALVKAHINLMNKREDLKIKCLGLSLPWIFKKQAC